MDRIVETLRREGMQARHKQSNFFLQVLMVGSLLCAGHHARHGELRVNNKDCPLTAELIPIGAEQ